MTPPPQDKLTDRFSGSAANQNRPQQETSPSSGFAPRSPKQKLQSDLIDSHDITFSVGPAGTGKTHVAMAKAVHAFKSGKIKKIIVARPAVSEDEDIGAVPGTKEEKMDDYMRPLYDELEKNFGVGKHKSMLANKTLEIVLLGKMRGRTFEHAFIILDEAQNCKFRQLKTALTRLGAGSKMVITGDPDQSDLPDGMSGLQDMVNKLQDLKGIAIQYYDATDVVRHPTVQRVIMRLAEETPQKKRTITPNKPGR